MLRAVAVHHTLAFAFAVSSLAVSVARAQVAPTPAKGQTLVRKGKAPVSDKLLEVKLPRPREGDLANGLHLIVLEDRRAPQANFQIIIPGAGGYFDAPGTVGLASVTAAMLREGTATRSTTQIAEQLETMAANLNVGAGMASLDATVSGSALTEKLDGMFDLAADVLLHPTFPESELTKYQQRTAASLAQQRSNAAFLSLERFQAATMGDHPGARVAMTPDDVAKVTRDDIIAFHRSHYVPDHAAIAFAGDISYDQAKRLVESKLGEWKRSGSAAVSATNPLPAGAARVHLVDRPNSVQTSFVVGAQAIDRTDPDYDVFQVLNQVVGGMTGRLFVHLREEKGYTYGAYSALNAGRFRGVWGASTDVRSEVTEPALRDLLEEIRQIRDVRVPAKELQAKKRALVASFALSLESPQQVLGYYITRWTYKLPANYFDQFPGRVMAVTASQVQSAAREYLDPSKVQIVAVGDGKTIEELLKKFGTVEVYDTEGKRRPNPVP